MYAQVLHDLVWNLVFAISLSGLRLGPFWRVILHVSDFLREGRLIVFIILKSTIHVYRSIFRGHHLPIINNFDHLSVQKIIN